MKKLFKALAVITSFSVLTRALGFFFRIFLSRMVGAEGLGIYQIAFSVFMVLETFISSGLPLVVSKKISEFETKGDKKGGYKAVTSALLIGICTSLVICGIVFMFRNLLSSIFTDTRCTVILLILLPSLVFSTVYSILRGSLWGKKQYFLVSLTEFIEQIIRIAFTVLFLAILSFSLEKVFLASISYTISCIVSSILVLLLYFKRGGRFSCPRGNIKPIIKSSLPITIVRVVSSLLTPLISVIIPLQLVNIGYSNDQALAIFGVAMGMTFPLLYVPSTVIGALSTTLIPDLSSAVFTQKYDEIKSKVHFSIKFAIFVSFIFIPLFFSLGGPIGMFFYNNADSGYFLSYSSFLVLPICLSGVTVSCLNALNLEVKSFINYLIGAIALVICIVFFTTKLGVLSLVWGMACCLGGASMLNIVMLNKFLGDNFFNLKYLTLTILSSLASLLMSRWIYNLCKNIFPMFISLALACIIATISYLIFGLLFNLFKFSFTDFKKVIIKKNSIKHTKKMHKI